MKQHKLKNGETVVANFPTEKHTISEDSEIEEYADASEGKVLVFGGKWWNKLLIIEKSIFSVRLVIAKSLCRWANYM